MEEAEALSKRIAILVEGQLMCIGNKTKLKNKFGKGFEIDIKTVKIPIDQYQIQLNSLNRKPSKNCHIPPS